MVLCKQKQGATNSPFPVNTLFVRLERLFMGGFVMCLPRVWLRKQWRKTLCKVSSHFYSRVVEVCPYRCHPKVCVFTWYLLILNVRRLLYGSTRVTRTIHAIYPYDDVTYMHVTITDCLLHIFRFCTCDIETIWCEPRGF